MREIAGDLRLELSQYEEVARFARFGTDLDPATQRQIRRGEHLQAALKQPAHRPLRLAHQLVIMLAAAEGSLDDIPVEQVPTFERELQERLEGDHPELIRQLERTGELTGGIRERFGEMIEAQRQAWFGDSEQLENSSRRSSG